MKQQKFLEALFILTNAYDSICYMCEIMHDNGYEQLHPIESPEKDTFHFMALFKQVIIDSCSFLEEYKIWHSVSEDTFKARVQEVRKIVKPAIDKIEEWKDLRQMRSELMAHAWHSNTKGNFTYLKMFEYNAPRTYWDITILRMYMRMVVGIIEAEFGSELSQVPVYISSLHKGATPPKQHADIFNVMGSVVDDINGKCHEQQKAYVLVKEVIVGNI